MASTDPVRHRRLLDAVVAIGSGLDLPTMLERIVASAAELVDARYGALGVLDATGERLTQFITVGIDQEVHDRIGHLPEGKGILGLLIRDAVPLRLRDLGEHPLSHGFPPGHPAMTSFLGVPLRAGSDVFGNLYLADKRGTDEFSQADEELVVGLAAAAGVAIDNARLHARVSELALAEDRERIARDLHDTVIQRLFAIGLSLHGTIGLIDRAPSVAGNRIESAVDDLDTTVKQIRSAIFALESARSPGEGLRNQVLSLCREAGGALGFDPDILFDGAVDAFVPCDRGVELLATLREALSNVARHAGASQVEVEIRADNTHTTLVVLDDGCGIGPERNVRGRGLANMEARAHRAGGTCSITRGDSGGCRLEWNVPHN